MTKKIAIFGANSTIAQDMTCLLSTAGDIESVELYARETAIFNQTVSSIIESNIRFALLSYESFSAEKDYDVIINCIGLGSPIKVKNGARDMYLASERYDQLIMTYLLERPATVYINFSSGAVYGENKDTIKWNGDKTKTILSLSSGIDQDFYTFAKINQEIRHRAYKDFNIIDLRIFGYISENVAIDSGFFLTEIFKAKLRIESFVTDHSDFYRDFTGAYEIYDAVRCVINLERPINYAYDIYSLSPVSKKELLSVLSVNCNFTDKCSDFYPSASRFNYFPTDRSLSNLGFKPKRSSMDIVLDVFHKIL